MSNDPTAHMMPPGAPAFRARGLTKVYGAGQSAVHALRGRVGSARILAVVDLRSNSMRAGAHRAGLAASLADADLALLHCAQPLAWSIDEVLRDLPDSAGFFSDADALVDALATAARPGDHILLMSNGAFGGVQTQLTARLAPAKTAGD